MIIRGTPSAITYKNRIDNIEFMEIEMIKVSKWLRIIIQITVRNLKKKLQKRKISSPKLKNSMPKRFNTREIQLKQGKYH